MTRNELDIRLLAFLVAEVMTQRHPDLDPDKVFNLTLANMDVLDNSLHMVRQMRWSGAIGTIPVCFAAKVQ